eukprot:g3537.t1
MLDSLAFVNIDIVALLGLKCIRVEDVVDVPIKNDFRLSLVIMTIVPLIWSLAVFTVWLYQAHKIGMTEYNIKDSETSMKRKKEMIRTAIEYIYSVVDFNEDGYIDDKEFPKILAAVNFKGYKKLHHRDILQIMDAIGASPIHPNRHLHDDSSSSDDDEPADGNFYNYDHEHHEGDEDDLDMEPILRVTLDDMIFAGHNGILNKYFGGGMDFACKCEFHSLDVHVYRPDIHHVHACAHFTAVLLLFCVS